jgi:hypothetical protein
MDEVRAKVDIQGLEITITECMRPNATLPDFQSRLVSPIPEVQELSTRDVPLVRIIAKFPRVMKDNRLRNRQPTNTKRTSFQESREVLRSVKHSFGLPLSHAAAAVQEHSKARPERLAERGVEQASQRSLCWRKFGCARSLLIHRGHIGRAD